jgi:predicted nucleic acid-binding protein
LLKQFLNSIFNSRLNVLSLQKKDYSLLIDSTVNHKLDFDDAYQYTLAKTNKLTIISFDADLRSLDVDCKYPSEILDTQ